MIKDILEIDSIQKRFNEEIILSDVYLKCETADVIGVLGRNGSGKSTLLKVICGIVKADFKFVRINGVVRSANSTLCNNISYLSQDWFVPKYLTVDKAIALSIEHQKVDGFKNDEIIKSIQGKKLAHLSGGELRYLEIKLVLSGRSKFVLLDEPYNGLSPIMAEKVNQLIQSNSIRKGIIITDHDYENVIKISTKLVLLKEGRMHHLKDKNELVDKGYLKLGML